MKIQLENMQCIKVDIGREIVIQRYRNGLRIMNLETGQSKDIKYGDLGEPI